MKKQLLLLLLLICSAASYGYATRNDGNLYSQENSTSETPVSTVAEVLAGEDGATYRVTGICTSITNTKYGNWYLNDGTGELYIYGTVNDDGNYDWASFNIEVGDEVTVEGPRSTYSTTVELIDATVISVKKAGIRVASISPEIMSAEGGDFEVSLENKDDINVLSTFIPEECQTWLTTSSIANDKVIFHAESNTGSARTATVTIYTAEATLSATLQQEGLAGSLEVPFTVEEAIAYCGNITSGTSPTDLCVKGKVSKIVYDFSAKYGTATFWISSDGNYNGDTTKDFEAYSVYYFNNEKWVDGNAPVSLGDEVLLYGKLTNYKGTAETSGKAAYIYSLNGVKTDVNGVGSEAAPFDAIGAIACANSGCTNNVYVNGTISKVVSQFAEKYGNGTFYISQDGTYYGDTTKDFEVYRALWYNNEKWVEGDEQVEEGGNVTVFGQLTTYKDIAETYPNKAYVVSYEAKAQPQPEETEMRLDSVVYYQNGELYYKDLLSYNKKGYISEELILDWSGEDWTNDAKYEYFYDDHGRKTQSTTYKWASDAWTYNTQSELVYDGYDNTISSSIYRWTDEAWNLVSGEKHEYTYDEQKRITSNARIWYQSWTDSWEYAQKNDYVYDENGNVVKETVYVNNYEGAYKWENPITYDYTYDAHGNETSFIETYEDGSLGRYFKMENTYDEEGNRLSRVTYVRNSDGEFEPYDKSLMTYNSNGETLTYDAYYYADGDWYLSGGTHYEYEYNDGRTGKVISEYSWDGITEQLSKVSYYSADGLFTGVETIDIDTVNQSPCKFIRDGHLVIRQADGHEYDINGVRVK